MHVQHNNTSHDTEQGHPFSAHVCFACKVFW